MDIDLVINVMKHAVLSAGTVVAPILLTGLLVGLTVGAIQAATQINEPTLTFVPKAVIVAAVCGMLMPWGLERFTAIFRFVIEQIAVVAGS